MRRQDRQVRRINIIQVIEDARLMSADEPGGLWIAPMPGVAGEEDLGVGLDQRVDRIAQRHLSRECSRLFVLSKQIT